MADSRKRSRPREPHGPWSPRRMKTGGSGGGQGAAVLSPAQPEPKQREFALAQEIFAKMTDFHLYNSARRETPRPAKRRAEDRRALPPLRPWTPIFGVAA